MQILLDLDSIQNLLQEAIKLDKVCSKSLFCMDLNTSCSEVFSEKIDKELCICVNIKISMIKLRYLNACGHNFLSSILVSDGHFVLLR